MGIGASRGIRAGDYVSVNTRNEVFSPFPTAPIITSPSNTANTANVPKTYNYAICYAHGEFIEVSAEEYERVKAILKCLNGELLKEIENGIIKEDIRENFHKKCSALFRMEI